MKFYVKNKEIITDKNVSNSIIVGIADLHYTKSLGKAFLDEIKSKIASLSPDYICFLGDLVDDDSKEVVDWLNSLAKICPVYFAFGNHDQTRYIPLLNWVELSHLDEAMLTEINNINNLTVLNDGKTICDNGYNFMGLPFYDIVDIDDFIEMANQYDVSLDENNFNTMLVHNPWIMKKDEFLRLKSEYYKTDLVMSGHTHNGLLPHIIDKKISGDKGVYAPSQGIFPEMTRGNIRGFGKDIYYNGIIVPALRTMPSELAFGDKIDKALYPPAIELVRVVKKK